MGRVGYLYESVKDNIRWTKLSVKRYVKIISNIGQIMALSDENYNKEKVKAMKMSSSSIAEALKSAFGDGQWVQKLEQY